MPGGVIERAGFRVRAIPSAHEGLDTDAAGHHLYLGFVIEAEGLRLYHSGDSLAYAGLAEQLGGGPFDVLFLPINGRDPARGVPGNMSAAEAVDLAARVRPRFVVPHHYDMFTFNTVPSRCSRPRPAGCPPGSSPGSCVRGALGDHAVSITLGIDIGTSGTKTLAIDERGTILASASAEYPCDHPRPGWSEQHPELWWDATVKTIGRVLAAGTFRPEDVAGHRPERPDARLGLPRRGGPGHPPGACSGTISARPRSAARSRREAGGREALIRLVANPALTGFTAPKLLWVRRHEPRNWERVRQVLLPKDYVRYRLTGTYATEVSDASGTLLLDVANRRWSTELLAKLQLDPSLLPPCYESPEVSGQVSEIGAKATGLTLGDAGGRRRRRPAGRGGGQRDRPPGRGLGDDGDLGGRLRARRPARLRPARPAAARLSRGAGRLARHGRRAGGGRQLPVVPQRAGQGRGRHGEGSGARIPTSC